MPFWLPFVTILTVYPSVLLLLTFMPNLLMSNTSKSEKLGASTEGTSVEFVHEAKLLLARCLVSLYKIDGAYFYEGIGTASIPGSLSHLLCITDEQLMTIYQSWYS